jgi:hypothetical protein
VAITGDGSSIQARAAEIAEPPLPPAPASPVASAPFPPTPPAPPLAVAMDWLSVGREFGAGGAGRVDGGTVFAGQSGSTVDDDFTHDTLHSAVALLLSASATKFISLSLSEQTGTREALRESVSGFSPAIDLFEHRL